MSIPKPTRRDCAAATIGAILFALVLAIFGIGPWRYQSTTSGEDLYILDRWTGRVRTFVDGQEFPIRSLRQQRREERIKHHEKVDALRKAATWTEVDGRTIASFADGGQWFRVSAKKLDEFVRQHPNATPINP